MEREANYAAVGAFVLLVPRRWARCSSTGIRDSREHRDFNRYEIYFDGTRQRPARAARCAISAWMSVACVRMRIDPREANRVQVIVDIDSTHADLRPDPGGAVHCRA